MQLKRTYLSKIYFFRLVKLKSTLLAQGEVESATFNLTSGTIGFFSLKPLTGSYFIFHPLIEIWVFTQIDSN